MIWTDCLQNNNFNNKNRTESLQQSILELFHLIFSLGFIWQCRDPGRNEDSSIPVQNYMGQPHTL